MPSLGQTHLQLMSSKSWAVVQLGSGGGHSQRHVSLLNSWFPGHFSTLGHRHLQILLSNICGRGHFMPSLGQTHLQLMSSKSWAVVQLGSGGGHSQRHVSLLNSWFPGHFSTLGHRHLQILLSNICGRGHFMPSLGQTHLHFLLSNTCASVHVGFGDGQEHRQILPLKNCGGTHFRTCGHWHLHFLSLKTCGAAQICSVLHTHPHVLKFHTCPLGHDLR
jgi:hypothetical protein